MKVLGKPTTIRVTSELLGLIKEIQVKENRSFNNTINILLDIGLKNYESKK